MEKIRTLAIGVVSPTVLYTTLPIFDLPDSDERILRGFASALTIGTFSFFMSPKVQKQTTESLLRGLLGWVIGTGVVFILLILYGAPVTPSPWPTVYCSVLLAGLTLCPICQQLPVLDIDVLVHAEKYVKIGELSRVLCVVLGTLIGAFFVPLDWEVPWQQWPIPVCYGAVAGAAVGGAVKLCVEGRNWNPVVQRLTAFGEAILTDRKAR